MRAQIDLVQQLKEIGVVISSDEQNRLTVLPVSPAFDFHKLEMKFAAKLKPENEP